MGLTLSLDFFRRRLRRTKTSVAAVAAPEPPRPSACPDPGAAAPTLSPFAEAVLAGAVITTRSMAVGLSLSLMPGQFFVAAVSAWGVR